MFGSVLHNLAARLASSAAHAVAGLKTGVTGDVFVEADRGVARARVCVSGAALAGPAMVSAGSGSLDPGEACLSVGVAGCITGVQGAVLDTGALTKGAAPSFDNNVWLLAGVDGRSGGVPA